jgi:RimJ/RimL family protein N-acetyltransferase
MSTFDWGERLPTIAGRRVTLRWLTSDDAPAVLKIFGDPEVIRYWSSPPLRDLEAAHELVTEIHDLFAARELFQWGVCPADRDEVIGTCTLWHVDLPHRRAEVGFAIAHRAWGQGLGTQALALLIDFCFTTLGLHRLEADVDPENARALRLVERLGFQREGYLRQRWHHLGELRDTVLLGLLRPQWRQCGPT